MKRRAFIHGLLVTLVAPRLARAADPTLAVVCNSASGVTSLTRAHLNAIFRAKVREFPNGNRASAVNLPTDHPARQTFDRVVLGMDPDEVERFWIDSKIRSGTGAPRQLPGPAAVARFVSGEAAGIGYVPLEDAQSAGLRVVALVREGRVVPS